jgi:PAS domain S-box-containing protein
MQGLVVMDRRLRVLAWNERFMELRGIPRDRMRAGMPFQEVMRAGASLAVGAGDNRRTLSGPLPELVRREPFCLEVHREDGLEIETRGQPMPDGHYVVTYSDVTQLRRSERAAHDQATRLKATLDHIVDGVVTINESGSIESFSAGAERMLGWRAEEVLRRDVSLLMPGSHAAGHGRALDLHRQTGVDTIIGSSRELEARRKDGAIVPVEISLGEVQLGDRHLYIGVLRDLTERRRVDRLQNELLSTVSHEFRTPLTSIVGALGLLKGGVAGELAPQARRLVELAHDNGHRLVRLVNDFLDLEKMRSGRLEFRLAPHALAPLLRQSVEAIRAYADGYGVVLAVELAEEDLLAFVDPERVQQVLANLISNAVKFSPRGGTVHVGLARDGGAAVISVRDEGPGIPPEFRARVFEKFAQADASDTRGRAGTGLGLSIVKSIVERLDGQVGFDSTPGKGTTFRVGLPLWHTKEATVTRHGGGRHVLVVEDDPDVALVLGELLRSAGYDARTVATGGDALGAIGAAPVDAVLLDLHLPDRNGRTLVHEFRAQFGKRPRADPDPVGDVRAQRDARRVAARRRRLLREADRRAAAAGHAAAAAACARGGRVKPLTSVLYVDDEPDIREIAALALRLDGTLDVRAAASGAEALAVARERAPDLMLLDVMMPDLDGPATLTRFRAEPALAAIPVVFVTAKSLPSELASSAPSARPT